MIEFNLGKYGELYLVRERGLAIGLCLAVWPFVELLVQFGPWELALCYRYRPGDRI